jgi:hypothetical protein
MYFTIRFMCFNIFLNNITLTKNALRRNPKILNRVGKLFDSKLHIMKRNKFYSAAITLLFIAFFATSWVSPTQAQKPTPVSISVPFGYTSGEFPNFTFTGTFTISGAFEASGTAIMIAHLNANAMVYHCIWTLTDDKGTFTLHEQCEMGSTPVKGRWEIVSGTGKYAKLRGNGSALMPDVGDPAISQEDLIGVIFK